MIIAAAAILMGFPALRGDFLSGDDLMLILRMPLVSDPSWQHAFMIIYSKAHADLYQPVPLLTFAWDFLVARWFGIAPDPESSGGGAFLFHLTNVLLHAGNALLVWWLIRRLLRDEERFLRDVLAALVALVFALHPMNVESVAWLNGRMTLLACGFEFGALLAMHVLLDRWCYRVAALALLLTLLSMASKVRIELPILLIMMPVLHRTRPSRCWWTLWGSITLVTAGFTYWNFETTQAIA
ncbi:MAG TPA: hypothetical protein VGM03_22025, partial [Phycisphaerae bacterium]